MSEWIWVCRIKIITVRRLCIIIKNVLLASVFYVLRSKDRLKNETNTHTNLHIQYSRYTRFTDATSSNK